MNSAIDRSARRPGLASAWRSVVPVLVAIFLAVSGSNSARGQASTLVEQVWDEAYRSDRVADSFETLTAMLDGPRSIGIADLDPSAAEVVVDEVLLRALRDRAVAAGRVPEAIAKLHAFVEQSHHPHLSSFAHSILGYLHWVGGDFQSAQDEWRRLGYLGDWWIVGPFESERGSGFGAPHVIEPEIDFDAAFDGKRNRVAWRHFSGGSRGGMVELGELFDPNEEALGFLVTHVHCSEPTRAVLRLGSTGSVAVWLDRVEVLRVDVERKLHFDQDAVVVDLPAGWTRVLVKSGQTKGRWAVRARWTDERGAPLLLESRAELEAGTELARGARRVSGARPFHGATTVLEDADVSNENADERSAIHLLRGYIAMDRTVHDVSQHPDREFFLSSVEARPAAIGHYFLAQTFRRDITHSAQREENRWRRETEKALALDPDFDRAAFDLAEYYRRRFGNWSMVKELVEPRLEREVVGVRTLELVRALVSHRLGSAAAHAWERRAVEAKIRTEASTGTVRAEAGRLRDRGRLDEAERLLRAGLEKEGSSIGLREDLASIALARGDEAQARAWIEPLISAYPQHPWVHRRLAELEASHDRFERALGDLGAALSLRPEAPDLLRLQGDYLIQAGRPSLAVDSYRASLELEPNQPRVREQVQALSSTSDRFGLAYRIDPEQVIANALSAEETDNDPYRVLLDNTAVQLHADGTTSRYRQYLVKVINDQGVRSFDYYPIQYSQGEQWVDVTSARVHHVGGNVEEARIRNRPPDVRAGEYPVWSNAWVDLPSLQPGDVVEIEYHQEDLKQSFFGDYFGDRVVFGNAVPVSRMIYSLEAPRGRRLFFHAPRLPVEPSHSEEAEHAVHRWDVRDLPKFDPEPGMPSLTELAPVLEVSTFEDWNEFADWYHHLIRKQFESSDEIRRKVRELVRDAATDRDRIRRLYEFVVTDVRYIAWEFGVHGFKPYNASTIFTRRFGDCKDKATLLCTMLSEIGVEAYPVLINAERGRSKEDLTLPLIHHFNHCIAYIPDSGDGTPLFVDGTAENHAVDQLPMMDRGAEVLVVRPNEGALVGIPWNEPEAQAVREHLDIAVDASGTATIVQHDELTGDFAVGIRSGFEIEGQRKRRVEQMLARRYPGVVVEEVKTTDLEDLTVAPSLSLRLRVPDWAEASGEDLRLPTLQDLFDSVNPVGNRASRVEREHDLLLGNPSLSELSLEIDLPPGVEVRHLPKSFELDSANATLRFEAEVKDRKIQLRRVYRQESPRIEAKDYAEFREIAERIRELARERIVLRKIEEVD